MGRNRCDRNRGVKTQRPGRSRKGTGSLPGRQMQAMIYPHPGRSRKGTGRHPGSLLIITTYATQFSEIHGLSLKCPDSPFHPPPNASERFGARGPNFQLNRPQLPEGSRKVTGSFPEGYKQFVAEGPFRNHFGVTLAAPRQMVIWWLPLESVTVHLAAVTRVRNWSSSYRNLSP